jgi:hypothetical protein
MEIGHGTLPPVAAGHGHRLESSTATPAAVEDDGDTADTATPNANKGKGRPTVPLAPSNLAAAVDAQSASAETAAASPLARGRSADTPAARARALIAEHPELADRPFGRIVSALARGLEVDLGADDPAEVPADGADEGTVAAAPADDETTDAAPGDDSDAAAGDDGDATTGTGDSGVAAAVEDGDGASGEGVTVVEDGDTIEGTSVAPDIGGELPIADADVSVAETLADQLADLLDGDDETTV